MRGVADRIFTDLQLNFNADICTGIYRRGKAPGDNGENNNRARGAATDRTITARRPLVIIFPSVAEKAAVFRNLKNLHGKEEWRRVYFNDDLTETQANEQSC